MNELKIIAVIPARGGSKGVKRKNLRKVGNKPLILHSIDTALKFGKFQNVIVSTDDEEIADIALQGGAEVPFMRPKALSDDNAPMVPVIKHAVNEIEMRDDITFDWIFTMQPTNPFRTIHDLDNVTNIAKTTDCDSIISVVKVSSMHPALMKKIEGNRLLSFIIEEVEGTRRQDYEPEAFVRNGSIYFTRRKVLLTKDSIWGDSIHPYIMPEKRSINIDSEIDLKLANLIMQG